MSHLLKRPERLQKIYHKIVLGLMTIFLLTCLLQYQVPRFNCDFSTSAFAADKGETDDKSKTKEKPKDEKSGGKEGDTKKGDGKDQTEVAKPCPECPECPDPAKFVLIGLEDRKKKLEKEEAQLKQEKKELETFKEEIDGNLAKLEELKKQIQSDLVAIQMVKSDKEKAKEAAYEAKMANLSVLYAKMPAKNAAAIFDKMDVELAAEIFARMPPRPASKILASVQMEQASKISERLAQKKK